MKLLEITRQQTVAVTEFVEEVLKQSSLYHSGLAYGHVIMLSMDFTDEGIHTQRFYMV